MKAIVFGARGQDGVYLQKLLDRKSIEVIGIDRSTGINLGSYNDVKELVKQHRPHYIFHLAANSTTKHEAWEENHRTIVTGGLHILEAVYRESPETIVFIPGSGLQFINTGKPIREKDDFFPGSSYALSRIHSVHTARYYRNLGLKTYVGYFFNHDSPLRGERHINKRIALVAKRIAEGSNDKLGIGDISVEKEFGFAGDIVEAVWTLVNQDLVFEATIGTGEAFAISKWTELVFNFYGLNWRDHVLEEDNFIPEYKTLVSDPSTIFSLGWHPKTSINQLAEMMCKS